jgi:hypothetical protein
VIHTYLNAARLGEARLGSITLPKKLPFGETMDDTNTVLEPTVTAEEAYEALSVAEPLESDISSQGRCAHWRS